MKPKVNLCVYNHLRWGVLDQIWFSEQVFAQHGYELICTNTLRPDCVNLLIENFTEDDIAACESFCQKFGKQVGIVMTEHIEMGEEEFSFNGASLRDVEYIANKEQRLFSLLALTDCVFSVFTLGELPELRTWSRAVPSLPVHRLPYPSIQIASHRAAPRDYDLVFTGGATSYRESVLRRLSRQHRLVRSASGATEAKRAELYATAKVAINIPQAPDWPWISPMRVLFGLRVGTPTVHLGVRDTTMFSQRVLEPIDLARAIEDNEALFQRQACAYKAFVDSKDNSAFPVGMFDAWAKAECLN